jgi:hypothetical protein
MNQIKKILLFVIVLLVFFLSGCSTESPTAQLIEVSAEETSYEEIVHINNCGGKANTEQVAAKSFKTHIQGGVEIGVGYHQIIESRVSSQYGQYRDEAKSLKLIAPPETNMEFVLKWYEEVRAGNVTVDGKVEGYNVRIPLAVEQVSVNDLGCGGLPPTESPPASVSQPTATQSTTITGSSSPSCGYSWEACWQIDDNAQTLTWVGVVNGESDIGQEGVALQKIRAGYTAIVNIGVDMSINICSGTIDGAQPSGSCPKILRISAGSHKIVSPGASGGFRIYP